MTVTPNTISKLQSLSPEKYEIVLDIIEQLSMNPLEMFDSMREDAQRGSVTEENADEFVLNIRKERNASRS